MAGIGTAIVCKMEKMGREGASQITVCTMDDSRGNDRPDIRGDPNARVPFHHGRSNGLVDRFTHFLGPLVVPEGSETEFGDECVDVDFFD